MSTVTTFIKKSPKSPKINTDVQNKKSAVNCNNLKNNLNLYFFSNLVHNILQKKVFLKQKKLLVTFTRFNYKNFFNYNFKFKLLKKNIKTTKKKNSTNTKYFITPKPITTNNLTTGNVNNVRHVYSFIIKKLNFIKLSSFYTPINVVNLQNINNSLAVKPTYSTLSNENVYNDTKKIMILKKNIHDLPSVFTKLIKVFTVNNTLRQNKTSVNIIKNKLFKINNLYSKIKGGFIHTKHNNFTIIRTIKKKIPLVEFLKNHILRNNYYFNNNIVVVKNYTLNKQTKINTLLNINNVKLLNNKFSAIKLFYNYFLYNIKTLSTMPILFKNNIKITKFIKNKFFLKKFNKITYSGIFNFNFLMFKNSFKFLTFVNKLKPKHKVWRFINKIKNNNLINTIIKNFKNTVGFGNLGSVKNYFFEAIKLQKGLLNRSNYESYFFFHLKNIYNYLVLTNKKFTTMQKSLITNKVTNSVALHNISSHKHVNLYKYKNYTIKNFNYSKIIVNYLNIVISNNIFIYTYIPYLFKYYKNTNVSLVISHYNTNNTLLRPLKQTILSYLPLNFMIKNTDVSGITFNMSKTRLNLFSLLVSWVYKDSNWFNLTLAYPYSTTHFKKHRSITTKVKYFLHSIFLKSFFYFSKSLYIDFRGKYGLGGSVRRRSYKIFFNKLISRGVGHSTGYRRTSVTKGIIWTSTGVLGLTTKLL